MKVRETNLPSDISRPGSSTPEMSRWPQGCGRYHAAVRSGAVDFDGLVAKFTLPAIVQGNAVQVTGPVTVLAPESDAKTPAELATVVSGVSADTENDPPHQAGIV